MLARLATVDADLGKAVVALYDTSERRQKDPQPANPSGAKIVEVGDGRGLILVDPGLVRDVRGVATIPFGGGRAFLALEPCWTTADLELAVVDCLEGTVQDEHRRSEMTAFRAQLTRQP